MRLVLIEWIEWIDAFGCSSSWQELDDDCRPKPMICRSVGWLFRDDKDYKVIVPHVADVPNGYKQGCGDMAIPTQSILQMYDLPEAKFRKLKKMKIGRLS